MEKHFTATALIIDDKKILLLFHKKLQSWLPPGGHLEENELPHECAIREAKEETGLDIQFISEQKNIGDKLAKELPTPYAMLEEVIPEHKGKAEHRHIDHIFLAKPLHLHIDSDEELQWFTLEEIKNIPKTDIFDNCRSLCLKALQES